ncbi:MAG TPA: hypothetical protein VGJ15_01650, partial [Pirellulales bacterium]
SAILAIPLDAKLQIGCLILSRDFSFEAIAPPAFPTDFFNKGQFDMCMQLKAFTPATARSRKTTFVMALLLLQISLFGFAPAFAADDSAASKIPALEFVPNEAWGVIVVPHLSQLDAKISKLGLLLKMPIPSVLEQAKTVLGIKEGVNEEGAVVTVLMPSVSGAGDEPSLIGFIPTTDYQKFINQFSPQDKGNGVSLISPHGNANTVLVAKKDDYVVFTHNSENERKLLDQVLQAKPKVPDCIAPVSTWIAQQDASYVITQNGFKVFIPKVREGLKQSLTAMAGQPGGENVRSMIETYDRILATAETDISQFGIGARIDADSTIRLTSRTRFSSGSTWGATTAKAAPLGNPPLAGLAGGPFFFAYDISTAGGAGGVFADFAVTIMRNDATLQGEHKPTEDDWKKLSDAMHKCLAGQTSAAFAVGVPQVGQSMFSAMTGVTRVDNAKTFMENYETQIAASNVVYQIARGAPQFEVKKWDVDGTPALETIADMSDALKRMQAAQQPGPFDQTAFFNFIFGAGSKMQTYLAPVDDHTVVLSWDSLDNLKKAMAAAKAPHEGLAADAGIKATSALLLKDAQWAGFLSPAGFISFTQVILKSSMPQVPIGLPNFPSFTWTPPIGLSAHGGADGLDTEIVVPAAVLEGAGTYWQQLQQIFSVSH